MKFSEKIALFMKFWKIGESFYSHRTSELKSKKLVVRTWWAFLVFIIRCILFLASYRKIETTRVFLLAILQN
jgi:hypothetical protein